MDAESNAAILEGLAQPLVDDRVSEAEENERAAAEAAKDLMPDYGESDSKSDEDKPQDGIDKVQEMGSIESTLHRTDLHQLSNSEGALDSLIGASTALEMSDDNTEYLKRYSERVAAEADQSDNEHKEQLAMQDALERANKKANEHSDELTVEQAREQAVKMQMQMDEGVRLAEELMRRKTAHGQ